MKKHINIILLLLAISLGMFSCSQSKIKENKAKKLALKELKNTMNDWKSYESVSWGKLDTLYDDRYLADTTTAKDMPILLEYILDKKELTDSLNKIPSNDKRITSIHKSIDSINVDMDKIQKRELIYWFKYYFDGYKIKHTFRGNNGYGAKTISTVEFFFNKDLTKVDSIENVNK